MRGFVISLLFIVCAASASAQLPFKDNFANDRQWTAISGHWTIQNHQYQQDEVVGNGGNWRASRAKFSDSDYSIAAQVTPMQDSGSGCSVSFYDNPNQYAPFNDKIAVTFFPVVNQVSLYLIEAGDTRELTSPLDIAAGIPYNFQAMVKNGKVSLFVDHVEMQHDVPTTLHTGTMYLVTDDTVCRFDNIRASRLPKNARAIFAMVKK